MILLEPFGSEEAWSFTLWHCCGGGFRQRGNSVRIIGRGLLWLLHLPTCGWTNSSVSIKRLECMQDTLYCYGQCGVSSFGFRECVCWVVDDHVCERHRGTQNEPLSKFDSSKTKQSEACHWNMPDESWEDRQFNDFFSVLLDRQFNDKH